MQATAILTLLQHFESSTGVYTDTRKPLPGGIFFALKGGNFNGNLFAMDALKAGAAFAVVDEWRPEFDERCLWVEDALKALQELARAYRDTFSIPVFALTGSNGKTTSKELITAVLKTGFRVHATSGNLNNHIGVPLTLLACKRDAEIMVIEMGANKPLDIEELCQIADPTHGLITNIGKAHLEGMGGIEGVARTKSELYLHLFRKSGHAFVNLDDPWLRGMMERLTPKSTYGTSSDAENRFQLLQAEPAIQYRIQHLKGNPIQLEGDSHLPGAYNFNNIMAALSVGAYFGLDPQQMAAAIAAYQPDNNRSQWMQIGANKWLMDAYNANPTSTENALKGFARQPAPRKIVILGDMLELGAAAAEEHHKIAELAVSLGFEEVLLCGPIYGQTQVPGTKWFSLPGEIRAYLETRQLKDATLLLKGSRGMRMEEVAAGSLSH